MAEDDYSSFRKIRKNSTVSRYIELVNHAQKEEILRCMHRSGDARATVRAFWETADRFSHTVGANFAKLHVAIRFSSSLDNCVFGQ